MRARIAFSRLPIYPWILASYPAIQLLSHNLMEVDVAVVIRPLVWSLVGASVGYGVLWLIVRNRHHAGLLVSGSLLLFFAYGHLYTYLRVTPILGIDFGRHRYLLAAYALVLTLGVWLWRRSTNGRSSATPWLNLASGLLVAIPLVRIIGHQVQVRETTRAASNTASGDRPAISPDAPDVYYIILDGYTRGDALQEDFGFDNSSFLGELERLGFYVGECSRSNYAETLASLTSSLNMSYIPELQRQLADQGLADRTVFVLIKQSEVMRQFEALGYRTVSFQTSFDWSDIRTVDLYLALDKAPINPIDSTPFEILFAETTAVKLLLDTRYLLGSSDLGLTELKHRSHIELQRYILDELPNIATIPEPTFTFAHILIPHTPYVFGPNGEIRSDPGFYSGEDSGPVNEDYLVRGYTGAIDFINGRMLEITRSILKAHESPPIIILQSDHGLRDANRLLILNAYYFPGQAEEALYRTISPVNSFRVLFDEYFGTDFGRLPDRSYGFEGFQQPVAERFATCLSAVE
jgi:hypothetical protein